MTPPYWPEFIVRLTWGLWRLTWGGARTPSGDPGSPPAQSGLAALGLGRVAVSGSPSPCLAGWGRKKELGVANFPLNTSPSQAPPPNLGSSWFWSSLTPAALLGAEMGRRHQLKNS